MLTLECKIEEVISNSRNKLIPMFASYVVWGYYISVNQTSQHVETIDNVTWNGKPAKLTIRKDIFMFRVILLSVKLKRFHFGTSSVWSNSNIVTNNGFIAVFLRKLSFFEEWIENWAALIFDQDEWPYLYTAILHIYLQQPWVSHIQLIVAMNLHRAIQIEKQ